MNTKTLFAASLLAAGCATTSPTPSPTFDAADAAIAGDESTARPVEIDGSLESYVASAAQARPELRAQLERWRAARYRVGMVDDLGPLTLSYTYFIQSVETRVGPQRHRVGAKQMFPWPGRANANAETARAKSDVFEQQYSSELLDVRWEVADAYWALWRVMEHHRLHNQHTEIVKMIGNSVRARVEIGQAQLSDVGQADLLLSRTVDDAERADEGHRRASFELARAAGLPFDDQLPVTASPGEPRVPAASVEQLSAEAAKHPRIEAVRQRREAAHAQADAAVQGRRPNFGVGMDWIETGPAVGDAPDSGKDPIMAGVSIELPIFSDETRAAEDAARAEATSYEADERAATRDAQAMVRTQVATIEDTAKRIRLYEGTLIPQAEAVLGSVQGTYEIGKTNIASLLLAQDELLNLRLTLAMVRAQHERQWVALEYTVGHPVDAEVYR